MSEANMKVTIPDDVIRGAVFGELARQLGDPAQLVAALVEKVLMRPVQKEQYSREQVPLWEKVLESQIEDFAKQLVEEMLEERKADIRAAVEKKLQTKTFAGKLATALVDSVNTSQYTVHLKLSTEG